MLGGIKMVHVPYRGAQPALTDVLAGHVDMFFDTLTTSVPLYRDGKLKILGVADVQRAPRAAGSADHLRGGPAGLPLDHLVRPGGAAADARGPRRQDQPRRGRHPQDERGRRPSCTSSRSTSARPRAPTPRKFFAEETALWGQVIKEAGITPQ